MSNVIAAISTPPGAGGLGVIRLSGDGAGRVAAAVFRGAKSPADMPGYTAAYGHAYDAEGDIDECVALVFRAPRSYTGEDVVELSCHGGRYILQRVLRAVLDAGARPAAAGEFTRRAFLHGKTDLTGAEAVMDLIAAEGKRAGRAALAAREGALFRQLERVKSGLLAAAAQLSAYVDYPDEDIEELSPGNLGDALRGALSDMTALLDTYDAGRLLREGIDTAIVGSPNVGKSTLMNMLAGCERSIVTPVAGTTRDVVEETVRLGDVVLRLADTAGIRETDDEVESIGVGRSRARMENAALVLVVYDGSRPLSEDDRRLTAAMDPQTAIAIINKADLAQEIDGKRIREHYRHVVTTSAKQGDGREALRRAIEAVTRLDALDADEPLLAGERQRQGAARCRDGLRDALAALEAGMTLDAVQVGLDEAIAALLELTGERVTNAVVDEIFERFCVGK